VSLKFEIAPPGKPDAFVTYIDAQVREKAVELAGRVRQLFHSASDSMEDIICPVEEPRAGFLREDVGELDRRDIRPLEIAQIAAAQIAA